VADDNDTREIRRGRIATALDGTRNTKEQIGLSELAKIWGVGKPAFVNVRDRISDFPDATMNGNTYLYPRKKALQALDRYERRNDARNDARGKRLAALVGGGIEESSLSIGELMKANQLRADLQEDRERQKLLVPKSQVQSTAAQVFTILQRGLNDLGTLVDPNGQFPPEIREAADKAGQDLLLRIHAKMRDMLAEDADRYNRPPPARSGDARARAAAPRSGRKPSVA
jgi:hypothetical protein